MTSAKTTLNANQCRYGNVFPYPCSCYVEDIRSKHCGCYDNIFIIVFNSNRLLPIAISGRACALVHPVELRVTRYNAKMLKTEMCKMGKSVWNISRMFA